MDSARTSHLVEVLRRSAHAMLGPGRPGPTDLEQTLRQIVRAAVDAVSGVDAAGITTTTPDGRVGSRNPTSDDVRALDQLQSQLHEGPCVSAATHPPGDGVVLAADLAASPDSDIWPRFAPHAVEYGYRSLMSTHLSPSSDDSRAALNLYSRTPHSFDESARAVASLFGVQAALLLHGSTQAAGLAAALNSRDGIGQAKGILMERFGVDADQAFNMLVQSSQETNIKLVDVAGWLTTSRADGTGSGPNDR